jgi:hypothetical protein
MANTWKPPKVLTSLKSTPPILQATNTTSKENPASQTKITKPGGKAVGNSQPLQMSQSRTSLHGAKDADTLSLLERIALLQGLFICLFFVVYYSTFFHLAENDKLMKSQAAKPKEKKTKEIPCPEKIMKLQHNMGLADDRRLYSHCRVDCFILFCFQPNT